MSSDDRDDFIFFKKLFGELVTEEVRTSSDLIMFDYIL